MVKLTDFSNDDQRGFLSEMAEESKMKMIYYPKLHFAMGSQWQHQNGHTVSFSNIETFIDWFDGLLEHLKVELTENL